MLFCLMGLVLSTSVLAQKTNKPPAPPPPSTPTDCKLGCTSNDVQIVKSYLSDDKGNKLGSSFICPQDGDADVYLTLELTTNTPRVGVVIYGEIWEWDPLAEGTLGTVPLKIMSECFGDTLNKPTNKVTFKGTFNWTCGTPIAFTKVFIRPSVFNCHPTRLLVLKRRQLIKQVKPNVLRILVELLPYLI
jgi:hypothetical protein